MRKYLPYWIIGLGFALRVYAALSHLDISHPDEHFQTLEPASHVVFGFGWMSWEWDFGTRSWFVPGLYMPLLWIYKWLGYTTGGPAPIYGCRVLMAVVSSVMLHQFWVLLEESGIRRLSALVALALFSFSPACVAWGAMTLSDVWAVVFLWCPMPYVLRELREEAPSTRSSILVGVLLGLAFLTRIQMVLWAEGIGLVFVLSTVFAGKRIPWRRIGLIVFGYGLTLLFQGVLDWITWGMPFNSVITNIQKNLFEHVASFFGTSPWYNYFLMIPENLGWPIVAGAVFLPLIAWILPRFSEKFRHAPRDLRRDFYVAVPALLYFAAHCMIPHKEKRFMFPLYPVFFYFIARGLSAFEIKDLSPKAWTVFAPVAGVLALLAAAASSPYVYSFEHIYPFDLSEITRAIREDGALSPGGGCILFLDHYWIWTRGQMMIGAPVSFIEVAPRDPFPEKARYCPYVITLPGRQKWFDQPGMPKYRLLFQDSKGQVLLKRVG